MLLAFISLIPSAVPPPPAPMPSPAPTPTRRNPRRAARHDNDLKPQFQIYFTSNPLSFPHYTTQHSPTSPAQQYTMCSSESLTPNTSIHIEMLRHWTVLCTVQCGAAGAVRSLDSQVRLPLAPYTHTTHLKSVFQYLNRSS